MLDKFWKARRRAKNDFFHVLTPNESWKKTTDPFNGKQLLYPPSYSPEDAISRAARARAGRLHEIILYPEHGNEWPLWDTLAGWTSSPEVYGLSQALTDDISSWMQEWLTPANINMSRPHPDKYVMLPRSWFAKGDEIADRIARETWHLGHVLSRFRGTAKPY
ncbi:hypothetical protein JSO19_03755 [Leucobacter sp. UCMA 4100]|uniref:hypothetical protein n=1 Tax=Leucobacter sp. UCMA 4100 TaxID=2810534 RepID=UPI0022EADE48|nr:hypothetical protein [Leucobacter sp. UCMA 4100]MDA3146491.1 hypothetical protein [Leucobacter sp. UCMA 4100]